MAFMITAHEDTTVVPHTLVQHARLKKYEQHMQSILFDAAYGSKKGQFRLFDPLSISTTIELLMAKQHPTAAQSVQNVKWSNVENNIAVSEYLDRYFHMLGWDNGTFTAFMTKPNKMLTANKSLPQDKKLILQQQITAAVNLGLDELGKSWRTCITADSHFTPFPQSGAELVPADGVFHTELQYLQARIDRLDDDRFWNQKEGKQDADKPRDKQTQQQQTQQQQLQRKIQGTTAPPYHAHA